MPRAIMWYLISGGQKILGLNCALVQKRPKPYRKMPERRGTRKPFYLLYHLCLMLLGGGKANAALEANH